MKYQIKSSPDTKRAFGRRVWSNLAKLPLFLRGPIIRRMFSVEKELPASLVFKVADTPEEIEQAFAVAFEGYRERGLMDDSISQLRVTKFHALPTTSIIIAKDHDQVVATLTVVVDSALGLPLEKLWNIHEIRKSSPRIAEISTLAIRRDYRSRRGKLLLPLMRFCLNYSIAELGVDKFVASVHPEVVDFYRCVLLFNVINGGEIKTYEFVKGAAAVAMWLSLSDLPKNYKKVYGTKPSNRNLYHFITEALPTNYLLEAKQTKGISGVKFTPALLTYFFKHKTQVMEELTTEERNIIANTYFHSQFTNIISEGVIHSGNVERTRPRFAVFYEAQIRVSGGGDFHSAHVLDVAQGGLRLHASPSFVADTGAMVEVLIEGGTSSPIPLRGNICWTKSAVQQIGVQLNEFVPGTWTDLIRGMENELFNKALETEIASKKAKSG